MASSLIGVSMFGAAIVSEASTIKDNQIYNTSLTTGTTEQSDLSGVESQGPDELTSDPQGADTLDTSVDATIDTSIVSPDISIDTSSYYYIDMEVDSVTGMPVDSEVMNSNANPYITENCYYDTTADEFVYAVGSNNHAVRSNIMDGMIVSDPVTISVDEGMSYTLYKNGTAIASPTLSNLTEPGSYVLDIAYASGNTKVLSFQIVGGKSNLEYYTLPANFTVLEVMMGDNYTNYSADSVEFLSEDRYKVTYRCDATGKEYVLFTIIDRTPPTLKLEAVSKNGKANGPVDISDLEEGTYIQVFLDGKEMGYKQILTDSGEYALTLVDEAGNMSTYTFTIMLYLTTSGIIFILFVVLLAVGFGAYIVYSKKHFRIR